MKIKCEVKRKKRKHKHKDKDKDKTPTKIILTTDALFKSIIFGQNLKIFNKMQYNSMSTSDTKLQDVLRLLYLWFRYGDLKSVSQALLGGFETISIDIWLSVIPQIIARLHIGNTKIRALIHGLLVKVGKAHPQSLIFPLTVASKSPNIIRKKSAKSLLDKIRFYNPVLVEQGEMVSKELLRVAILWHEMWYEALIEASRLFWDKSRNVNAMVARLKPLYDLLLSNNDNSNKDKIDEEQEEEEEKKDVDNDRDNDDEDSPNDKNIANKRTLREQAFEDAFKFDLLTAWELVNKYQNKK